MERLTVGGLAGHTEELILPELGGTVLVHGLTRAEMRVLWEQLPDGEEVDRDLGDYLLAALGVSEPALGATLEEAIAAARSLPAGALSKIVARVSWLSGLRGMVVPPGQTEAVPAAPFRSGETDDDRPGPSPGAPDSP